jgi:hypothetical protein
MDETEKGKSADGQFKFSDRRHILRCVGNIMMIEEVMESLVIE